MSTAASARDREAAAVRSATLATLFDRLAAADSRVRHRGSAGDDDDGAGDASGSDPSGGPPAAASIATRAAAAPPPRRLPEPVLMRNGRAVVLSARSRRLPPAFQEQAKTLRSVEAATATMTQTLQQLHRDLAAQGRGRGTHGVTATAAASGHHHHHPGGGEGDDAYSGSSTMTAAAQRRVAAAEARMEQLRIQRARAAAADEGASDDQSVEDYGVDCDIPPLTSESRLADEVAALAVHFAKAKASALAMAEIEELAPTNSAAPWWSSALRLRDMKAQAARLDYHAHGALGWSYRAREQLLLQVAHLNNVSASTRDQLLQQQRHWQEFQTRLRDGQAAVAQMQCEIAQWQAQAQEEANKRSRIQGELVGRAQERGVVDSDETNNLKAELALLLEVREWPTRTLERDAQTVLEWLRCVSTPLE